MLRYVGLGVVILLGLLGLYFVFTKVQVRDCVDLGGIPVPFGNCYKIDIERIVTE